MGSDCEPISRFRWTTGGAYLHSVDAREEVAMNLGRVSSIAVLAACLPRSLPGQPSQEIRLDAVEALELHHLKADVVTYLGRTALRIANTGVLDFDYGEGLAIVRGVSLRDGTIESTLSGDTLPNAPPEFRGFVGIAFRVTDRSHFECLYIRPRNGRSQDQLHRNHSRQYISIPGFPWNKLRDETPGEYESYVDLVPGQWTETQDRRERKDCQTLCQWG